jgi:hydrogenase maturation protease
MELWTDAQMVILLDAVSSGGQPGKIFRFNAHDHSIPSSFFKFSSHNFSLAEAIELARTLNRLPPRLIIYGIEGLSFEEGRGLSLETESAAMDLIERIIGEIYKKNVCASTQGKR